MRHVYCTFPIFKAFIRTKLSVSLNRSVVSVLRDFRDTRYTVGFVSVQCSGPTCTNRELIKQRLCVGSEEGKGGRPAFCACRWSGRKMMASPKKRITERLALLSNQMASSPLGGTVALALPEAEA